MIETAVTKITYHGDGSTTQFPFSFPYNDGADVKVAIYDTATEIETVLTSDYYVDTVANKVIYPGYPVGEEPPLSERPPVLPVGQNLTVFRSTPISQLEDLGDKYPLPIVEGMVDKNTMILQEANEKLSRAVLVDMGGGITPQDVASDIKHLKEYRDAAESAKDTAVASATAAALSETNAAASAAAAAVSETNAAASETNAAASATAALASQNAAANSATQSANSATQSANSATASANSAAQSAGSATEASVSASQAATNASTSTAAAGVVQNLYPQILTAATNTGINATAAQAAATSAQASAATATTKAELATDAADDAEASALAAAASATAAANSAGAAATSATEAAAANTEAKYYAKITMDKVAEAAVGFPTQEGTLTYDGTEQEPTWDIFFEAQKLTVTGTLAATNAGTYTVTMTPKPTYYWWDTGTTETRTQTWTIGRAAIEDIPSQAAALVFDGTVQSPTWNDYDPTELTIGGTTSATEAGTYTATFTPTSNYQWSDTTITAKSVTWEISSATVAVPTVTNTSKTYNGSAQSPTISTYDPLLIEVTGDTQTDAGSYNVVFHLKSASLTWTDTTTADKTAAWSIAPKVVTVPTVTGTTYTYDGTAQGPTIASYDPDEVTASGDITATNAGNYALTLSLTSITNYVWADTTTAAKVTAWTIAKAAGSLSISPTTISLDTSTLSDTITVTRTGDGAISAVSSDTSIATVSLSGNTITVTAVATGNVTVTVSVAEGTNWLAATNATCAVAVQLIPTVLNDATWEQISQVAQAGTGENYWDIGDVKMITLNGKIGDNFTASNLSLGVFVLDFNHADNNVAENNIIFGGFKSALSGGKDVALIDIDGYPSKTDGTKMFNFNHWGNSSYGGWSGSDLRYDILGATRTQPSDYGKAHTTSCVGYNAKAATLTSPKEDTLLAALPSDLRSKIRLRTHYVDNKGNQYNMDESVTAVTDAVFLLAEFEIFGSRTYANQYEQNHQAQMKYYDNGNSKTKYKHNSTSTAAFWWGCSPRFGNNSHFCIVGTADNDAYSPAEQARGLAPAFKI